jgi:hypothetical protein
MKSLQTIKKEVLKLNKTTQAIDPGILELVVGLRAFNIPTQYSCAGHKGRNGTFPYIDIHEDDAVIFYDDYSTRMIKIKKDWIKKNVAIQRKLINLLTEFYKNRKVEYKYQISLHTMIDWAWLRLKSIGSDLLKDMPVKAFQKELLIYQNEMKMFGYFLIEKYQKM